ncbi:PAS domain S-box protein [Streptomyces alfalfae]|uniref:protein-serine/threonine phosphatase n=1 Tax=Streptomyces alfalfae TaxID=1642299 RepID=A0A4Q7F0U3_9ACTN|nr:SpoIIE family protein phosphatase [Streptomyces alfalfae]AYA20622.1 PAS domain S-box protein [Streptomyces fradiae]QQC87325.1 SpoIIE family protein phosphatase [Streptomyces alfalfae]QUI29760.1 SpoIIE family protein phosphatase [Streptomyces alfalfae]RXX34829.1 PAS domain S-box protein [Streptomyces alfalfae]RZM98552.1 PAS domain S-box protein [Streptomyces alfalfae]
MDSYSPPAVPFQCFPPEARSVPLARRFVRSALRGVAPEVVDTAELLASELVTNAVLHARTEVEVRVWSHEGKVRVRVGDGRPERPLVPREARPYAGAGRGLAVVEKLASSHGAHVAEGRKTAWFELWPKAPVPPTSGWESVPVCGRTATVTLIDMHDIVFRAAQQHGDEMLRELILTTSVEECAGVSNSEVMVANDVTNVINACMTSALEETVTGGATVTLDIAFPLEAAPAVDTLRHVLEHGDAAAQLGSLLTLPAPPHVRSHYQWVLDQLATQLSGGPPTAWTLLPGAPNASSAELTPWDAGDVEDSSIPTVAADDDGRIIATNTALADLLGWQTDELIGRPLTVLIPEHLRERHRAGFTALRLTGRSRIMGRSIPLPALHRDGSLVPVRLHVQSQEAVDGRTVRIGQFMPRAVAPGEDRPVSRPDPGPSVRLQTGAAAAPRAGGGKERRDRERSSLLADTTSALSSTLDLREGLRRVCHVLTQQMADWCVVDLLDEYGDAERVCVVHREPRALNVGVDLGRLPPLSENARGPLARVLHGAGPLLITDIPSPDQAESALDARQLELFEQLNAGSTIMAPLRARHEVLGALIVVRTRHDDPFTEQDALLVADLVKGISLSVDNARLHQHTRTAAERLQRSLLPRLPSIPSMEITARYAPSSTTAQVGGDWFDAFTLPDGDTALVIGDVSGHDLNAAVTMSQLRNMLRGIAVDCQDRPSEVLRRLDLATLTLYPHSTATCAYAVVKGPRSGPWEVHHSSAGHLPLLLTCPNGDTHYLDTASGLLIGMDSTFPRPTARDSLPAHSTLLMFTDGLIERPGESLSDAMTRLRRHTAALARAPLDVFCDELILGLGAGSTDDIALLALRPTAPGT